MPNLLERWEFIPVFVHPHLRKDGSYPGVRKTDSAFPILILKNAQDNAESNVFPAR